MPSKALAFLSVFLILTRYIANSAVPADLPPLLPSSCLTNADCPFYTLSKCSLGQCTSCASNADCNHIYSPGNCDALNGGCIVPCASTNDDLCLAMRTICDIFQSPVHCKGCTNDMDCSGYSGYVKCYIDGLSGICAHCSTNADCPSGSTCQNFKCVQCTSNAQCSAPKPYCDDRFEGNFCKQCLDNTHCTSASLSKCSSGSCTACSSSPDCAHITGKLVCSGSGCVDCTSASHCTDVTKSFCNIVTNTCRACTTQSECSHLTATPFCVAGVCVEAECTTSSQCTDIAKSYCNVPEKYCQLCSANSQCSHLTATPICGPSGCVCLASLDCTNPALSYCNTGSQACQLCTNDDQCSHLSATPICSPIGCVESGETPTILLTLPYTMQYMKYLKIKVPSKLEQLQMSKRRNILSLRYGMHMQDALQSGFTKMPLPDIYERHGLHSSFLVNFWQEIISLAIIALAAILFTILELLAKKFNKKILTAIFTPFRIATRYNFMFLLIATSIGDVILYSTLEFSTFRNSSSYAWKYVSYLFSLCFIGAIIGLLAAAVIIPNKVKKVRDKNMADYSSFITNWPGCRVLYNSFNLNNFIGRYFFMVYTLRLGVPMIIACAFTFSPITQAILQLLISIAIFVCVLYFKPIQRTVNQIQLALIEGIVLILNIFLLVLTIYDVYEIDATKSANVFGYIIFFGNIIINALMFIFLFIKLGLEIKTILSLRKQQTTPEKISAWLQLLYIPIQQGAIGFETVFKETSSRVSPQRVQDSARTIAQSQPLTSTDLNAKSQTSLNASEIAAQGELKGSSGMNKIPYLKTNSILIPRFHEPEKSVGPEKIDFDRTMMDQSYNGSFLMEDSHRELLPELDSEAKSQQNNRNPASLPNVNRDPKPQQKMKLGMIVNTRKISPSPPVEFNTNLKLNKPGNSSMIYNSPTLAQKASPTLKPAPTHGKARISTSTNNNEYAVSYENWLEKTKSSQTIQYDPAMSQFNSNNNNHKQEQPKNNANEASRGLNHIRHNNALHISLNKYFKKLFNNQGGPKDSNEKYS